MLGALLAVMQLSCAILCSKVLLAVETMAGMYEQRRWSAVLACRVLRAGRDCIFV
jgi:hypothetical protein